MQKFRQILEVSNKLQSLLLNFACKAAEQVNWVREQMPITPSSQQQEQKQVPTTTKTIPNIIQNRQPQIQKGQIANIVEDASVKQNTVKEVKESLPQVTRRVKNQQKPKSSITKKQKMSLKISEANQKSITKSQSEEVQIIQPEQATKPIKLINNQVVQVINQENQFIEPQVPVVEKVQQILEIPKQVKQPKKSEKLMVQNPNNLKQTENKEQVEQKTGQESINTISNINLQQEFKKVKDDDIIIFGSTEMKLAKKQSRMTKKSTKGSEVEMAKCSMCGLLYGSQEKLQSHYNRAH